MIKIRSFIFFYRHLISYGVLEWETEAVSCYSAGVVLVSLFLSLTGQPAISAPLTASPLISLCLLHLMNSSAGHSAGTSNRPDTTDDRCESKQAQLLWTWRGLLPTINSESSCCLRSYGVSSNSLLFRKKPTKGFGGRSVKIWLVPSLSVSTPAAVPVLWSCSVFPSP